jgi:hypothetical protein
MHNKSARHQASSIAALSVVLAAVIGACTPPAPSLPPPPATVVREETRVLSASARTSLLEARPDGTLVFSSAITATLGTGSVRTQEVNPSQLKVGDVIVSEPTTAAPYGLLRKVTNVVSSPAGTIAFSTVQAKIGDAIKSGRLTVSNRVLTDADLESVTPLVAGTVRVMATDLTYSIDAVLLDQDGNDATKEDQVRATGSINLKPSFDADISLDCGPLCIYDNDLDFLFKLKLQEQAKLQIVGKVGYGASLEKSVFALNFSPITFFIGPVPVVITPRLTLKVKLDGSISANAEFQTTQTLDAVAGVQYDDGWDNLSSITNSFTATTATAALNMNATARAPVQSEFLFYGVVGPTMGVAAKLNLDVAVGRDPLWKLSGGVEGTVGVKVDVLGYSKEYSKVLFDLSRQIGQSENTAPTIQFIALSNNQNVDVNTCCTFSALVSDLEDGTDCCATTFFSNVDGPLGNDSGTAPEVSRALTTLGIRTITATARDSKGATSSATITINAINTAPTVAINVPFANQQVYQGLAYTVRGSSSDRNEPNSELPCTGSSLRWTSSVTGDAQVTGCAAQMTFASSGPRTLTLTGTDGFGATGTATVAINVLPPPANLPPVVNVSSPKNNVFVGLDSVLTLTGSAADPEGSAVTTRWDATLEYDPTNPNAGTPVPITLSANNTWKPKDLFGPGCGADTRVRLRFLAKDAQNNENSDFVVLQYSNIC